MATADAALHLPPDLVDALVAHAVHDAPREACGLLIGRDRTVIRAVPARNVDPRDTRYTIAPEDHFAALRAARRDGLEVLGAYHSHPAGSAEPSGADTAEAFPDFAYVIVGLVPAPRVRAWRLVDGNFAALSLVRT